MGVGTARTEAAVRHEPECGCLTCYQTLQRHLLSVLKVLQDVPGVQGHPRWRELELVLVEAEKFKPKRA